MVIAKLSMAREETFGWVGLRATANRRGGNDENHPDTFFDPDHHNVYAADDVTQGRSLQVAGSFRRARKAAVNATANFLEWARNNMHESCRRLLFCNN
jgi:hypothetical protein